MKSVRDLIDEKRCTEARAQLRARARNTKSSAEFSALCQAYRRLTASDPNFRASAHARVALLGTGTTNMIEPGLALALETWDIASTIRRVAYNSYAAEMLDANSETAAFRPDVALVVNSPASLPVRPTAHTDQARVASLVEEVCDYWLGLCRKLHEHTGCEVILDNFHSLPTRPLGNLATKVPGDTNTFLRHVNLELGMRAPSFVHINDVDAIASQYGVRRWFDARYWYHAKLPFSLECLPLYVRSVAAIIGAILGRTSKCVALDLDNTLWGGIIGDDGVDGIKIGQGDAVGEAFLAFQKYLIELKERGVLLAVCSKNDEANALAAFEHPEMALKRNDFVAFKANWDSKPRNLRLIAQELNIGIESLVFVDDNPREREHVRQELPEVRVLEVSEDVAEYPCLLDETGWFESVRLSREDRERSEQYRANTVRASIREAATDYDAYLADLGQIAVVAPYEPKYLDRIVQLINKTNQFNLNTRRQLRAEVEQELNDPERLTAYVRLADRFGDNGLISVFSSHCRGCDLVIDQWLMSCRVFSRGVEQFLFNWVAGRAREFGVETIRGAFMPTAKNRIVEGLYYSLGFRQVSSSTHAEEGATYWRLQLAEFSPFNVRIRRVEDY